MEVAPQIIPSARIKVVGVGGAGGNVVNRMIRANLQNVEFIAVNSDAQDLQYSEADVKVHIGQQTTKGLGAGGDPEVGMRAAEENVEEIRSALEGADMIFVVVGLGGGTGSLASSVVSQVAREEIGALTIAVVTKPFGYEGNRRAGNASVGHESLKDKVDALITIPNDNLMGLIDKKTSLQQAFEIVDDVVYQAVSGIANLITTHGVVNVDFADIKSIMQMAGSAHVGIGIATGENRAIDAAKAAIDSPLLEVSMHGSKGILVNVTGGDDLSMWEIEEAANAIRSVAAEEANIIVGAIIDESRTGEVAVTVISTGFDTAVAVEAKPSTQVGAASVAPSRVRSPFAATKPRAAARPFNSSSLGGVADTPPARPAAPPAQAKDVSGSGDSDDPDVPAFIRRRMK